MGRRPRSASRARSRGPDRACARCSRCPRARGWRRAARFSSERRCRARPEARRPGSIRLLNQHHVVRYRLADQPARFEAIEQRDEVAAADMDVPPTMAMLSVAAGAAVVRLGISTIDPSVRQWRSRACRSRTFVRELQATPCADGLPSPSTTCVHEPGGAIRAFGAGVAGAWAHSGTAPAASSRSASAPQRTPGGRVGLTMQTGQRRLAATMTRTPNASRATALTATPMRRLAGS